MVWLRMRGKSAIRENGVPGWRLEIGLKDAAELEEPVLVAGVAYAAADEDGAEEGFGEDAACEVAGKFGSVEGVAVHFADFGEAGEVALFADERREGSDFVEVAGSANEILVADEFVEAVGAEASNAPEKIDGRGEGGVAEGGSAFGAEEEGATRGDGLEGLDEEIDRWVGVGADRSGVKPLVTRFEIEAAGVHA